MARTGSQIQSDRQAASTLSLRTLEETPARAVQFLRAIGTTPAIRSAMQTRGYGAADHAEGWRLVQSASGVASFEAAPRTDHDVAAAIASIDAVDEDVFRIVASATRKHPEVVGVLLEGGLAPSQGPQAVLGIARLLDRFEALEERSGGKSGKVERAALETFAARGLGPDTRKQLRTLIRTATRLKDRDPSPDGGEEASEEEARTAALGELRAWFEEWTMVARATIKRRDHLIRLGLARRAARSTEPAVEENEEEAEEPPTGES